jgi:hypothetical protein
MVLDQRSHVEPDPLGHVRRMWQDIPISL